jgi:stress response protein YsnF
MLHVNFVGGRSESSSYRTISNNVKKNLAKFHDLRAKSNAYMAKINGIGRKPS